MDIQHQSVAEETKNIRLKEVTDCLPTCLANQIDVSNFIPPPSLSFFSFTHSRPNICTIKYFYSHSYL